MAVVRVQLESVARPEIDDEARREDDADGLSVWRHTRSAYGVPVIGVVVVPSRREPRTTPTHEHNDRHAVTRRLGHHTCR
jgi:hypothetical protein